MLGRMFSSLWRIFTRPHIENHVHINVHPPACLKPMSLDHYERCAEYVPDTFEVLYRDTGGESGGA